MYENLEFFTVRQITKPHGILPISRSGWWAGVQAGKFPQPQRGTLLGPRVTIWRKKDIYKLLTDIDSKFEG